ncbi:hypothetical protein BU15DRAFT_51444 [Melanogaster broomeanus]|nr:hypothetical protein BU15DRAFT_51444 [Melanogaster broomeanus]
MHSASAAASCACTSSVSAHSSSESTTSANQSCSRHTSSIPVSKRNGADDTNNFVNCSAPQCCHCGWRGSHAPTCPFR